MRKLDSKYSADVVLVEGEGYKALVLNHDTGEVLPEDEPLIVFRAKDRTTRRLISFYRDLCTAAGSPRAHLDRIDETLRTFEQFAADHPERMKTPD